jgi:nitrogen-specific signal transduction histidine kinase
MSLRRTLYMFSSTLKGIFFVILVLCILGAVIYTQQLVSELRKESRDVVDFYAQTYQRIASDTEAPEGLGWFFVNVIRRTNFPLVLTDIRGEPNSWKGIEVPENDRSPEALKRVKKIMEQMQQENKPVAITHDGQVINYLYYGDSKLITRLVSLPYVTLSGLVLLVLVALLGFGSIKRSEQRFIWVGMAKETAHQLGTPISSLMGWLEVMKTMPMDQNKVHQIAQDIESDVKRLEKVAARFSQIGSEAALRSQDIHPILRDVVVYFKRRLPHSGKEMKIVENYGSIQPIPLNRDLFEWVVENLIKNGLDAIKGKNGVIEISTGMMPENGKVFVDIADNGSGISAKRRNDIFKPGYSTKKRGWGLGLNIAKRIVEDYHRGKLFIKETHVGKGTTMRIVL